MYYNHVEGQLIHLLNDYWSRDGPTLEIDKVRRSCGLQDRGTVQGRSGSRQHVVAHHCGGKEAWPAQVGILRA